MTRPGITFFFLFNITFDLLVSCQSLDSLQFRPTIYGLAIDYLAYRCMFWMLETMEKVHMSLT